MAEPSAPRGRGRPKGAKNKVHGDVHPDHDDIGESELGRGKRAAADVDAPAEMDVCGFEIVPLDVSEMIQPVAFELVPPVKDTGQVVSQGAGASYAVYEVERLLDRRLPKKAGDAPQYLVKWRGWDLPQDNTWEPLINLTDSLQVLAKQYPEDVEMAKALAGGDDESGGDQPPNQEEEEDLCCVCSGGDSIAPNEIVYCEACGISVHQACYGLSRLPKGVWLCQRCQTANPSFAKGRDGEEDQASKALIKVKDVSCAVCPITTGAFKKTKAGKWGHVVCTLLHPEAYFDDPVGLNRPTGFDKIRRALYTLTCSICNIKKGAPLQCAAPSCRTAFHPTCAAICGYWTVWNAHAGSRHTEVHCPRHSLLLESDVPSALNLYVGEEETVHSLAFGGRGAVSNSKQAAKSDNDLMAVRQLQTFSLGGSGNDSHLGLASGAGNGVTLALMSCCLYAQGRVCGTTEKGPVLALGRVLAVKLTGSFAFRGDWQMWVRTALCWYVLGDPALDYKASWRSVANEIDAAGRLLHVLREQSNLSVEAATQFFLRHEETVARALNYGVAGRVSRIDSVSKLDRISGAASKIISDLSDTADKNLLLSSPLVQNLITKAKDVVSKARQEQCRMCCRPPAAKRGLGTGTVLTDRSEDARRHLIQLAFNARGYPKTLSEIPGRTETHVMICEKCWVEICDEKYGCDAGTDAAEAPSMLPDAPDVAASEMPGNGIPQLEHTPPLGSTLTESDIGGKRKRGHESVDVTAAAPHINGMMSPSLPALSMRAPVAAHPSQGPSMKSAAAMLQDFTDLVEICEDQQLDWDDLDLPKDRAQDDVDYEGKVLAIMDVTSGAVKQPFAALGSQMIIFVPSSTDDEMYVADAGEGKPVGFHLLFHRRATMNEVISQLQARWCCVDESDVWLTSGSKLFKAPDALDTVEEAHTDLGKPSPFVIAYSLESASEYSMKQRARNNTSRRQQLVSTYVDPRAIVNHPESPEHTALDMKVALGMLSKVQADRQHAKLRKAHQSPTLSGDEEGLPVAKRIQVAPEKAPDVVELNARLLKLVDTLISSCEGAVNFTADVREQLDEDSYAAYLDTIKPNQPMCLDTMRRKASSKAGYNTEADFQIHLEQIAGNCHKYCSVSFPDLPPLADGLLRQARLYLNLPNDPLEPTYCTCHRVSFGEMIACDNPTCELEWFHFDCVSYVPPPVGETREWFCPDCMALKKEGGLALVP